MLQSIPSGQATQIPAPPPDKSDRKTDDQKNTPQPAVTCLRNIVFRSPKPHPDRFLHAATDINKQNIIFLTIGAFMTQIVNRDTRRSILTLTPEKAVHKRDITSMTAQLKEIRNSSASVMKNRVGPTERKKTQNRLQNFLKTVASMQTKIGRSSYRHASFKAQTLAQLETSARALQTKILAKAAYSDRMVVRHDAGKAGDREILAKRKAAEDEYNGGMVR